MKTLKQLVWTPTIDGISHQKKWIIKEIGSIGIEVLKDLAMKSTKARIIGYQAYSGYKVGAALLDHSGIITLGSNIEIASYSETGHAEEDAIKCAVLGGAIDRNGRKFIRAIAVSCEGDSAPCGRCRQIIIEFCDNALIIIADTKGNIVKITSMDILLPCAFKPSNLGKD